MASHVKEKKSSFYDYETKAEMEANIAQWKHMALEVVLCF
jgi:hypothetical protein